MREYMFTEAGMKDLEAKIRMWEEKADQAAKEKKKSARGERSAPSENGACILAERDFIMCSQMADQLREIRRNAIIVPKPPTSKKVTFGSIVLLLDLTKSTEIKRRIGSYMTPDDSDEISYESPLAGAILGARVGEEKSFVHSGKERTFRILEIR